MKTKFLRYELYRPTQPIWMPSFYLQESWFPISSTDWLIYLGVNKHPNYIYNSVQNLWYSKHGILHNWIKHSNNDYIILFKSEEL